MLAERELEEVDGRDLFGLSRFLYRRGEAPRAAKMCSKAIEAGLPAEHRQQASRELALMAKRRGDHAEAAALWKCLLSGSQNVIEACEQLAIHFERREKDLEQAIEYAQLGLTKVYEGGQSLRDSYAEARIARQEKNLLRRAARLKLRLANEKPQRERMTAAAGRFL
jgi:tetratricopeptide (TPR) repeat protein